MQIQQITPEVIIAGGTAASVIITAIWKLARRIERKAIFNGDEDQYERRNNSITKTDHLECKKNRENVEKNLIDNQKRLEENITQNRKETREDLIRLDGNVQKMGEEGRKGRDKIFIRLESDRKEILKKLDKMNGGR